MDHGVPFELPNAVVLSDDLIELRPIRLLGPADAAARPPGLEFLAAALEYRFDIHRRVDGLRIGRIHLRSTADPGITRTLGHLGYAVDEEHRCQGYAVRGPENIASCRVVERCNFELIEELGDFTSGRRTGPRTPRPALSAPDPVMWPLRSNKRLLLQA